MSSKTCRSASDSAAQPGGDQLDQAGRRPERAAQAPDPALVAQSAVLQRTGHQLVEEEGIAQRALGELSERHGVDRASQDGDEEVLDGLVVERVHFDPRRAVVLPEHDHGIGARHAGPSGGQHAGEHGGRTVLRKLVDQRGGAVVEQMRVVDEDEQRPPPGVVQELVRVTPQLIGM